MHRFTHSVYPSAAALSDLKNSDHFRKRVATHQAAQPIPDNIIKWLPFTSLEQSSLREYKRTGEDFVAFCTAHKLQLIPISYRSLTSFFYDYFRRGNTTRTFNNLASRIKWYITNVCGEPWIDEQDPVGYRAWLAARRALQKVDATLVSKKKPLYKPILKEMLRVAASRFDILICTIFLTQHACMQRLGELVNGTARRKHLRHYVHPDRGPFFVFFYLSSNKPKAHKIKQAPYAIISQHNRPLVYNVLSKYLTRFHSSSDPDTYLFPYMNREDNVIRSTPLSFASAVKGMRNLLKRIGLNKDDYGGQSARRGGFLDNVNVPLHFSQTQGHWSVGSTTTLSEYGHQGLEQRLRWF